MSIDATAPRKFVRFLTNEHDQYQPTLCAEASPGITYLRLGVWFDIPTKFAEETILVPSNISESAMDILRSFWEYRVAEEFGLSIEEYDDVSPYQAVAVLGAEPDDQFPLTTRHEDLVQQALADYANGAASPFIMLYYDVTGGQICRGDKLRHTSLGIVHEVVSYGCHKLALRVPQEGHADQIIHLSELDTYDADSNVLGDWIIDNEL